MSELVITPWKCPFCVAGLIGTDERCIHCAGTGLTDDPCGDAERAPRPPGVMRTACADCAYRQGSPELENAAAQLPDAEPFYCHQGLPVSATGAYTPTAMFRGLPLGAMVCAGWWAVQTGEPLPEREFREVPIDPGKQWDLPYALRADDRSAEQVEKLIAASSLGAPVVAELAAHTSQQTILDISWRAALLEEKPYILGVAIPAEYLGDGFPLHEFFRGLAGATQPTAASVAYVAAWLGEPVRDPGVESVPCSRHDCQAPPGEVCRTPHGPDYWLPDRLHIERREAFAAQILAEALQEMRETVPVHYIATDGPIGPPPALTVWAMGEEDLSEQIHRDVRQYLGSKFYDVQVDLDELRGSIVTGSLAGRFTIEALASPDAEVKTPELPRTTAVGRSHLVRFAEVTIHVYRDPAKPGSGVSKPALDRLRRDGLVHLGEYVPTVGRPIVVTDLGHAVLAAVSAPGAE